MIKTLTSFLVLLLFTFAASAQPIVSKNISLVSHIPYNDICSDVEVYTEGTFGLLPHGLELYSDGRTKKLKITGLYPISDIPPLAVRQNAERNSETYFILNNTQVKALPPNSTEIMSFKKADESYIRLYQISP